MKDNRKIIYHMTCGCSFTKDTIHTKPRSKVYYCQKHKAILAKRTAKCFDCETIISTKKSCGNIAYRCHKHTKIYRQKERSKQQKETRVADKEAKLSGEQIIKDEDNWYENKPEKSDISRVDCKHYLSKCLMKYIKLNTVPCKNCMSYSPTPINADALAGTYRHCELWQMAG